jgi:flagellin-specific chaperone FliS
MELSDELYDRIEELSETGNEAMESEDYAKAISCFQEALDILNRRKTGKHISGSPAQSVTPIS